MIRMTACDMLFGGPPFRFAALQTCSKSRCSRCAGLYTERVGGGFQVYARLLTVKGEAAMRLIDTGVLTKSARLEELAKGGRCKLA